LKRYEFAFWVDRLRAWRRRWQCGKGGERLFLLARTGCCGESGRGGGRSLCDGNRFV